MKVEELVLLNGKHVRDASVAEILQTADALKDYVRARTRSTVMQAEPPHKFQPATEQKKKDPR